MRSGFHSVAFGVSCGLLLEASAQGGIILALPKLSSLRKCWKAARRGRSPAGSAEAILLASWFPPANATDGVSGPRYVSDRLIALQKKLFDSGSPQFGYASSSDFDLGSSATSPRRVL